MSGIYTFTEEPTLRDVVRGFLPYAYLIVLLIGLVLLAFGPKVMEEEPPEEGP